MTAHRQILGICVLLLLGPADAWISSIVVQKRSFAPATTMTNDRRISSILFMSSLPPPEEEDGCASEEECEIDWDNMPGFGDEEEGGQSPPSSAGNQEPIIYNDFENDLDTESISITAPTTPVENITPNPKNDVTVDPSMSQQQQAEQKFKHRLVSLEMNWQMQKSSEECDVEIPTTCGGKLCSACQGRGKIACRFCRGTHFLKFEGIQDFYRCTICKADGMEVCHGCQGSGWVADWTQMAPVRGGGTGFNSKNGGGSLKP